jgi:hypothetical protein
MMRTLILAFVLAAPVSASAEICRRKIDNNVERLAGYKWQWRKVDGQQCWFYSNRLLPVTDLIWSFTEEEFNSDIDRVIERKFYLPDMRPREED